jgi:hypothetical protein
MRHLSLLAATAFAALAITGAARAGEMPCWMDHGVVVVSAAFGDITGDFLFDLSAPKSELHVDVALEHGIITPTSSATLRLGDQRIPAMLTVANLDARTIGLPTTLNGLIGADVLKGYVIDLRLAPCRLALWPRRAPAFHATMRLPVTIADGVPTVGASVTDAQTGLAGAFAIDTGSAGVRLATRTAHLSRTRKGVDAGSRLHPPARLAALSLGGDVIANAPAAIAIDLPDSVLGGLGTQVWSRYAVRLDLRRKVLELAAPQRSLLPLREKVARGADRMRGRAAVSARRSARSPGS